MFYHVYVAARYRSWFQTFCMQTFSIFVFVYSSHIQGVKALRLGNIYRDCDQQDLVKSGLR